MRTYGFEKLIVWQEARQLSKVIYMDTKIFPKEEKYGITSQVRRACISICCNIAEGSARKSYPEKLRFIDYAYGSLMELLNLVILSNDFEYLEDSSYFSIRTQIDPISYKLSTLKKSYEKAHNKTTSR